MNLTPKQLDLLVLLRRYRHENGISPTLGELAESTFRSKISVRELLVQLQRKGAIKWKPNLARSIEIVGDDVNTLALAGAVHEAVDALRRRGSRKLAVRLERLFAATPPDHIARLQMQAHAMTN